MPAIPLKQRRDPAIPITSILAGKSNDGLCQTIFILSLCRPIALRAAWLLRQAARSTLGKPMLLLRMRHRTTASLRA
jgi:hypothetical protein